MNIIDLTNDGRGVIKENGKVIFTDAGLPGDQVEIKITKEKKKYSESKVLKIKEYSKHRKYKENPLGSAYPLYPLDYAYGFDLKCQKVAKNMKKIAGLEINPILHPNQDYRVLKLRLHKEGKKIGLYQKKSHSIYEPDYDILLGQGGNELIADLKEYLIGGKEIIVRKIGDTTYLSTDGDYQGKAFTHVTAQHRQTHKPAEIEIKGLTYQFEVEGFFQNNRKGAEIALEIIGDQKRNHILDLYSGVGFLSLFTGKHATSVLGIELNEKAVRHAKVNAKRNGIKADFQALDTRALVEKKLENFETIIVDPPRSGLIPELIDKIIQIGPDELVYMSCDHTTQARDLIKLSQYYHIKEYHIIDMFPGSMDVETVALLDKEK